LHRQGVQALNDSTCFEKASPAGDAWAVVPAAGRGVRMGLNRPKQFAELGGKPLLVHTLEALAKAEFLSRILVVVPPELQGRVHRDVLAFMNTRIPMEWVAGGAERQESVFNALEGIPEEVTWVLVHDGVRPFPTVPLMYRVWEAARAFGAAVCGIPATDTVKRATSGLIRETLPRDEIWLIQTPQIFRRDVLVRAFREAVREGFQATDDAALVERLGHPVAVVPGDPHNIKITRPEDLQWARSHLARKPVAIA
jgi:2-C-methyl-D-erythritol 4-phosphate cytidylyltransferase